MIKQYSIKILFVLLLAIFVLGNQSKFKLYLQSLANFAIQSCEKSPYISCLEHDLPNSKLPIGIYSTTMSDYQEEIFSIKHFFLPIDQNISSNLDSILGINFQGKTVLITFEPFQLSEFPSYLSQISNEKYWTLVSSACSKLNQQTTPIFIRFGHEMEKPVSRYPWSQLSPESYIQLYQKFVSTCKTTNSKVKFVFSPLGMQNAPDFYPGDDVVDVIGFPVFYYEKYAKKSGHEALPIHILQTKYDLFKKYNKPLLIGEFGIISDDKHKTESLMLQFFDYLQYYPLLNGLVFYSAKDHIGVWGENLEAPNFQINKKFHLTFKAKNL